MPPLKDLSFLNSWDHVVDSQSEPPDPKLLHQLFYKKVRSVPCLAIDVAHYERQHIGHPDRTYEFLKGSAQRYLDRARQMKNHATMQSAHSQGRTSALAATAGSNGPAVDNVMPVVEEAGTATIVAVPGVCYNFRDTGVCPRGENCKFSHDSANSTAVKPKAKVKAKAKTRARSKSRDSGSSEGEGNVPRVVSKTACRLFQNGSCHYGDKCRFSHESPEI